MYTYVYIYIYVYTHNVFPFCRMQKCHPIIKGNPLRIREITYKGKSVNKGNPLTRGVL